MENFPETGEVVRLPTLSPFPALLIVYAGTTSVSGPRSEQEIFGKKKIKILEITAESEYFIIYILVCVDPQ